MIQFFRQIRKQLLIENRFTKYLLYAIGEIFLVVIGILIALQINNANENHKVAQRNLKNLSSLMEELKTNKVTIAKNLEVLRDQISHSLYHIDSLSNPEYKIIDFERYFLRSQNELGPLNLQSLATTSLSELISSGGYSEIVSDSIKTEVLLYQSRINDLLKRITAFDAYWNNIELPHVMAHHSLLDMWVKGQHIDLKQTEKNINRKLPHFNNNIQYFPIEMSAYKNNRTYANMYVIRFFELERVLMSTNDLDELVDELKVDVQEMLEK